MSNAVGVEVCSAGRAKGTQTANIQGIEEEEKDKSKAVPGKGNMVC